MVDSNAAYQRSSMFYWSHQIELNNRRSASIEDVYDRLGENTAKCGTVAEFRDHLRTLASLHNRLYNFNRSYRHREKRALVERQRQMTMHKMADSLLGDPAEKNLQKPLWVYKQSRRYRKRGRQRARRGRERPQGAAVVAFSDADLHSLKGNPPVPVKKFRQVLLLCSV
ncbi:uncharacterized protein BYT42DRAFT_648471 [Radiomyces spectabilis]|uniref:uncharacterized protein n=1 Tax=Radiomyces spectabilis TaxID=64574 RepID=UPI00221E4DE9|nr:uncharacterized protein BYT42DRAFT_648471 [Radiomyces spectabilis]KAI8368304.1 hypothetical protein BYT42DRAFT_648471 [Radiomyces spectabilis]